MKFKVGRAQYTMSDYSNGERKTVTFKFDFEEADIKPGDKFVITVIETSTEVRETL